MESFQDGPQITHSDVAQFAEEKVNLRREDAKDYRDQVNNLRDNLAKYIQVNPDVGLIKMLLSGSLAKGTALKTLNDIDVALYLDAKKTPMEEAALLPWLVGVLRKGYPQMKPESISLGTHCVQISFKTSGLNVDVVPVRYEGDSDDRGYLYDRETGQRVLTSIPLQLQFIRNRKEKQPVNFSQVIRLCKYWVRQQKIKDDSFRFKSFIVEMVVAHILDSGMDMSNYPDALEGFFAYLRTKEFRERIAFDDFYSTSTLPGKTGNPIEVFDPVNPANNAAKDYSEQDRKRIVDAAEHSLDALSEARFSTTRSRAVECWQEVLGVSFR